MLIRKRVPFFCYEPDGLPAISGGQEVEEEEFEIEVIDPNEEAAALVLAQAPAAPVVDPLLANVLQRNADLMEGLSKKDDEITKVSQGLQRLTDTMGQQQWAEQQRVQGESEADYNKRLNEEFYKAPAENLNKIMAKKDDQMANTFGRTLLNQAVQIVEIAPETSVNYTRFKSEMDQAFGTIPPQALLNNPQVVKQMYEVVLGRHTNELVTDQVTAGVQSALEKLGIKIEDGKAVLGPQGAVNSSMQLSSQTPAPGVVAPSTSKKVRITAAKRSELVARAESLGLDWEDFARVEHEAGRL